MLTRDKLLLVKYRVEQKKCNRRLCVWFSQKKKKTLIKEAAKGSHVH